jgi:hypothetical protein
MKPVAPVSASSMWSHLVLVPSPPNRVSVWTRRSGRCGFRSVYRLPYILGVIRTVILTLPSECLATTTAAAPERRGPANGQVHPV